MSCPGRENEELRGREGGRLGGKGGGGPEEEERGEEGEGASVGCGRVMREPVDKDNQV